MKGARKLSILPLQLGEGAIPPFLMQRVQLRLEKIIMDGHGVITFRYVGGVGIVLR